MCSDVPEVNVAIFELTCLDEPDFIVAPYT